MFLKSCDRAWDLWKTIGISFWKYMFLWSLFWTKLLMYRFHVLVDSSKYLFICKSFSMGNAINPPTWHKKIRQQNNIIIPGLVKSKPFWWKTDKFAEADIKNLRKKNLISCVVQRLMNTFVSKSVSFESVWTSPLSIWGSKLVNETGPIFFWKKFLHACKTNSKAPSPVVKKISFQLIFSDWQNLSKMCWHYLKFAENPKL